MKDRIVQHPNRYRLTPVSGQNGVYDLEPVPGTVTQAGTPLNKATLLTDQDYAAIKSRGYVFEDSSPETTISKVLYTLSSFVSDNYTLATINFKDTEGNRMTGTPVQIFAASDNESPYIEFTVADKDTMQILLPNGTYTAHSKFAVLGYNSTDVTFTLSGGNQNIDCSSLFAVNAQMACIDTSGTYMLPPTWQNIDICLIGGGMSGSLAQGASSCGGGAGGYTSNKFNVSITNLEVTAVIGTGGASVAAYGFGNEGGTTSITLNDTVTYSANGGKKGSSYAYGGNGGSGGGGGATSDTSRYNGGSGGSDGSAGEQSSGTYAPFPGGTGQGSTTRLFGEANGTLYCGGGGGCSYQGSRGTGGAGGGGAGAYGYGQSTSTNRAQSGTLYGAGGGGANAYSSSWHNGPGAGYQGAIFIRKHVDAPNQVNTTNGVAD